jgi:hypothetical protein
MSRETVKLGHVVAALQRTAALEVARAQVHADAVARAQVAIAPSTDLPTAGDGEDRE